MTTSTIAWWCLFATLIFWSVGAYNRLVRLRSQTSRAFTAVAVQLQRYVDIVSAGTSESPHRLATDPAWAGLQGALQQLAACLAVARGRPLQAAAIQALAAAEEVVQTTWLRTSTEADGQDGAPLPQALLSQWKDTHGQLQQARLTFAQSVQTYNFAITQFPAGILAWLFGFRLATAL